MALEFLESRKNFLHLPIHGDASILQKIGNQTNDMLKTLTKAQVKTRTDVKELVAGMRSDLL